MALRKILTDGDTALHKMCRPVTSFDARLHTLLDDLKETLADANGAGVGQRLGVAAVVAHEPTVGRVVGQVDGAAGARGHLAALAAGDHAAGPPAVEEENTLLPRLHGGGQPGPEGPAE